MKRRSLVLAACAVLALAGCDAGGAGRVGPDGKPLPQVYKLGQSDVGRVQIRMLDSVNALRGAAGVRQVQLNAQLNAAAATHSRDMAVQNRPWHFGSDGSSPLQRAQRVGYTGQILGELISETYETELETLAAWMESPEQRAILLDPNVGEIGFAFFQESNGKLWWTLSLGAQSIGALAVAALGG